MRASTPADQAPHDLAGLSPVLDLRPSDSIAPRSQDHPDEGGCSLLLDHLPIALAKVDADGRPIAVNHMLGQLLGTSAEALLGQTIDDWFFPGDLPLVHAAVAERRPAACAGEHEVRVIRTDGAIRWCSLRAATAAHTYQTILSFHDITEQRAESERAVDASALLKTIIDSAEDLIFVKDRAGRFVLLNRQLEEAAPELIGRKVEDAFPANLAEGYVAADNDVITTGMSSTVEELIPLRGEARIFQTIKVPWCKGDEIQGVIGISRDITERRAAEARLREREERYRLAARATNDVIWDWDLTTDEVTWNDAIETLRGGPAGCEIGWWKDQIHPDDRDEVTAHIERFIAAGGEYWQQDYRFARLDGSYAHVLDRGYLIRDENGRPVRMIGAMLDLSQREMAQQRLQQLQSELIHVSRVSAMGTMGSALAHELNQPLAGIANYISGARRMLEERGADAIDEVLPALDFAGGQAIALGEMIRRLRRMVAHGRADVQPARLHSLVKDALSLAIPNRSLARVEVAIDLAPGHVMADAVQIQQVLVNLIRNAVDAMAASPTRRLRIWSTDAGNRQRVRISDSGCGLSKEVMDGLFSAFRSTKPDGLGVGLTICRTIVEAHGGSIGVEHSDASGTTMYFELPTSGS